MGGHGGDRGRAARHDVRRHHASLRRAGHPAPERDAECGAEHHPVEPGAAGRPYHGERALDPRAQDKHARTPPLTREPNNPARRGSFWAFMLIGALIFVGGFYALYHRQQAANDPNGMLSRAGGGESIAGKNDTSVDKSNELGPAEDIQKSTRSKVTLSPEQRQRRREILKASSRRIRIPRSLRSPSGPRLHR